MILLLSFVAAITVTVIWYISDRARKLKVGIMCYMFWGASIMWLVDSVFEYINNGADYFNPPMADMINDGFLGLSIIVLGNLIWTCTLLIKDPEKIVQSVLSKKQ